MHRPDRLANENVGDEDQGIYGRRKSASERQESSGGARDFPAEFEGILFQRSARGKIAERAEPPDFFRDLNLDQIVDAITAGREEYNLKPYFYTSLTDKAAISYRQEIMRDLKAEQLFECIKSFSSQMRSVGRHLKAGENSQYKYFGERWFLDAVAIYCEALLQLRKDLDNTAPMSRALQGFRRYLIRYLDSDRFKALLQESKKVKSGLQSIRYCLLIKNGSFTVRNYNAEENYTVAVEQTYEKFRQGNVKDYRANLPSLSGTSHIEAAILERVAQLNPDAFQALSDFCATNEIFAENPIVQFEREIQFYLSYLEYAEKLERSGLKFCFPEVSDKCKSVSSRDGFDMALAGKLLAEGGEVVCNDFILSRAERVFVVTGPNQGGKTTFARMFGQLHYLAGLGCPVPGSQARLFLFDRLFTHFEREEDMTTLRGKLQDDLMLIRRILDEASSNSIVILNETFSSTSVKDGVYLGSKLMERLLQFDLLGVYVTFLDELSSMNEKIVSMVATVAPDNPTVRTFKVERRSADGLAYALALAEKHKITYECLKERLQS
jgi:DNA mismatch repair protein MutS